MSAIKSWVMSVAVASALMVPQAVRAADDLGYDAIRNHDWATAERVLQEGLQQDPGNTSRQLNVWHGSTHRLDERLKPPRSIAISSNAIRTVWHHFPRAAENQWHSLPSAVLTFSREIRAALLTGSLFVA